MTNKTYENKRIKLSKQIDTNPINYDGLIQTCKEISKLLDNDKLHPNQVIDLIFEKSKSKKNTVFNLMIATPEVNVDKIDTSLISFIKNAGPKKVRATAQHILSSQNFIFETVLKNIENDYKIKFAKRGAEENPSFLSNENTAEFLEQAFKTIQTQKALNFLKTEKAFNTMLTGDKTSIIATSTAFEKLDSQELKDLIKNIPPAMLISTKAADNIIKGVKDHFNEKEQKEIFGLNNLKKFFATYEKAVPAAGIRNAELNQKNVMKLLEILDQEERTTFLENNAAKYMGNEARKYFKIQLNANKNNAAEKEMKQLKIVFNDTQDKKKPPHNPHFRIER